MGTCPRRPHHGYSACRGYVRGWEFGTEWHGRTLYGDDLVPCPEHNPVAYARRTFAGAKHKGRRKWWKR